MANINFSTLYNLDNFNIYDKIITLGKGSTILMLPKTYDSNNPYINTIDNSYQLLYINFNHDPAFSRFISNFKDIEQDTNLNVNFALFSIVDDELNFIEAFGIHDDYFSINTNLATKENILFNGININGININCNLNSPTPLFFNSDFKITFTQNINDSSKYITRSINKYYKLPQDFIENNNALAVEPSNQLNKNLQNINTTNIADQTISLSYSENDFNSYIICNYYKNTVISDVIINDNNPKEIMVLYKNYPNENKFYIDFYKSGILLKRIYKNFLYIMYKDNNTFNITKTNGEFYECELNQNIMDFINFNHLKDLNDYYYLTNDTERQQFTFPIQLGDTIISTKYNDFLQAGELRINNDASQNEFYCPIIRNQYVAPMTPYYYTCHSTSSSFIASQFTFPDYGMKKFYTFKNFTISLQYGLIIPNELLNNNYIKKNTITNVTNPAYPHNQQIIYNHNEFSIVKITNADNVYLIQGDAKKILDEVHTKYYLIKSNLIINNPNYDAIVDIYNNIQDSDGALKNIDYDATNSFIILLDNYEIVDNTSSYITYNINIYSDEIYKLINNNKFIKFINTNNKYYLQQNGYKFKNIADLKYNLFNIINTYSIDKININNINQVNTDINYIEDFITIQNSINKTLYAMSSDGYILFPLKYNQISYVDNQNTETDTTNEIDKFNIAYFVDEDGTIYNTSEINYILCLANEKMATLFNMIVKVDKIYDASEFVKHTICDYIIDDITNAETSYELFNNNYQLSYNITDSTNLNIINDSTSLTIKSTNTTEYNSISIDTTDIIIYDDEYLDIDIELDYDNTNLDEYLLNIFHCFDGDNSLDIAIENDNIQNVIHIDYRGHTINNYNVYYDTIKFKSFGLFHKKCISQYNKDQLTKNNDGTNINNIDNLNIHSISTFNFNSNTLRPFVYDIYTNYLQFDSQLNNYVMQNYVQEPTSLNNNYNIQPANKNGHTFFISTNLNYFTRYSSYQVAIANYGCNYTINARSTFDNTNVDLNFGISIRPYKNYNQVPNNNLHGANLNYLYDTTTKTFNDNIDIYINLNRYVNPITYYGEKIFINNTNKTKDLILSNRNDILQNSFPNNKVTTANQQLNMPILNNYQSNLNTNTSIYNGNDSYYYLKYSTINYGNSQYYLNNNNFYKVAFADIIDFNYNLNSLERNYLFNNKTNIANKLINNLLTHNNLQYKFIDGNELFHNISLTKINIKLFIKYNILYIYVNNTLLTETIINNNYVKIKSINLYENKQIGDKKIILTKNNSILTKKSGFWC